MKKSLIILFALMALASCKDQVAQVSGSYSYKISGTTSIANGTVALPDEIGALDIIRLDSVSALLTFNALSGPAYTTTATIEGKEITLEEYERTVTYSALTVPVTASGEGTIYDGTIVIDLHYASNNLDADLVLLCKKN